MTKSDRPRVKDVKGTVRAYLSKQSHGTKEYVVILQRGSEEDLIDKLDGNLANLVTFCDNNFNFNDKIERHYGGRVQKTWLLEQKDTVMNYTRRSFCYSEEKPSEEYVRAYLVDVYID